MKKDPPNPPPNAVEERLRRAILNRVKLSHLRVFLEVARQESVSRAAIALNIAQPAVTKTLRDLEQFLEMDLFERRARGVVLNESGRLVLPHVQAVFAGLGRIGDQISSYRGGWSGTITVGATMSALPFLLPRCLSDERVQESGALVRVQEGTVDQMLRALMRGEIDLVLGRLVNTQGSELMHQELVLEDPFVPVVGGKHPLTHSGAPKALKALSNYPWIMPPLGSSAAEPLERYMMHHHIRPLHRIIETVSYQTIIGMLEYTDSVAILPRHLARNGEQHGTLSIVGPVLSDGLLPIGITHRTSPALTPLAEEILTAFRNAAKNISG